MEYNVEMGRVELKEMTMSMQQDNKATVTRGRTHIHFTATLPAGSRQQLEEAAGVAQVKAGYHPAGYGGPLQLECKDRGDGYVDASWKCYTSCD